jgi:hypothetical protein
MAVIFISAPPWLSYMMQCIKKSSPGDAKALRGEPDHLVLSILRVSLSAL